MIKLYSKQILKALIVSMFSSMLLLILSALFLYKIEGSAQLARIFVYGIYLLSGFVGGFVVGKLMQSRRLLWAILLGILYSILLMLGLIVRMGSPVFSFSSLLLLGLVLLGSIIGGMMS